MAYHKVSTKKVYSVGTSRNHWEDTIYLGVESMADSGLDHIQIKLEPRILGEFLRQHDISLVIRKARTWWHVEHMYIKEED